MKRGGEISKRLQLRQNKAGPPQSSDSASEFLAVLNTSLILRKDFEKKTFLINLTSAELYLL